MKIHHGITRSVILIGRYAIKFPSLRYRGRFFCRGTICNRTERAVWLHAQAWDFSIRHKLAPSLWCGPFGLFLIQRRCEPLPPGRHIQNSEFIELWYWGGDHKDENYGLLNGRLVMLDYA